MSDTLIRTETLESDGEAPAPGCTCCKPPEPTDADRLAELEARRAELDRRLARLPGA